MAVILGVERGKSQIKKSGENDLHPKSWTHQLIIEVQIFLWVNTTQSNLNYRLSNLF